MGDGYWRYGRDPRYQQESRYPADPRYPAAMVPPSAAAPPTVTSQAVKRHRPDFGDLHADSEMLHYYLPSEERSGRRSLGDTEALAASYDRYIRNGIDSYGDDESVRPGLTGRPDELRIPAAARIDDRPMEYGGGRPEAGLPPDASNTLYVEGLPANCTRREVSHIFRPFVGFLEVRLVKKESKHPGADPLILCFVDFNTASQAVVALEALQGYKFDEHDRESNNLRLQFARFAGPRSGGGSRSRR